MKVRICIEVSGGMVQNVYAIGSEDVDVTICDFDIEEDSFVSDTEIDELHREFDAFRADPGCCRVW